jgi:hypothetical protein
VLRLDGFEEWADPAFVLGRTAPQPRLVVLREDRDESAASVKMYHWVLSDTDRRKAIGKDCTRGFWDEERLLNDCAEATIRRSQIAKNCTQQLDRTWLVRPPLVLPARPDHAATDIVFTRVVAPAMAPVRRDKFALEIRIATVLPNGQCSLAPRDPLALSAVMDKCQRPTVPSEPAGKQKRKARTTQENAGEILAALRALPILVADLDTGDRHIVVPNTKCASKSLMHPLR